VRHQAVTSQTYKLPQLAEQWLSFFNTLKTLQTRFTLEETGMSRPLRGTSKPT